VWSGMMSARICVAKGDSASTMPATKAPNTGENPSACDSHAAPVAVTMASRIDRSRFAATRSAPSSLGRA
jgi:hypothetical protein